MKKNLFFLLLVFCCVSSFSQDDGASLDFDGVDDHVMVSNKTALEITGNLTLECWAYLRGNGTYHFMGQGIANTDNDAANTNILYLFTINSNKTLELFMETGSSGTNIVAVSTIAAPVEVGEWHHYAVVRNHSTKRVDFYVDGIKLGGSVSYPNAPTGGATNPFTIGGLRYANGSVEKPFLGRIDEVRVWNTVRTQAQIVDNMDCILHSSAGTTVTYHFYNGYANADNTGRTSVSDGSGNLFHATLVNFRLTGTTSNFSTQATFFEPSVALSSSDADDNIIAGESVTFSVNAINAGSSPTFQWQLNSFDINGATDPTYTVNDLKDGDQIRCIIDPSITCINGTITSSTTTMVVQSPLPLRLIDFSATTKNGMSILNWATADEVDVSIFELEESTDGMVFRTVKNIVPTNVSGIHTYSVTIPTISNTVFYRLKMIDLDGTTKLSAVVSVISNASGIELSVFPNPVKDRLTIKGASNGSSYNIYDKLGKKVLEGRITEAGNTINTQRLLPGLYILKVGGRSFQIVKE